MFEQMRKEKIAHIIEKTDSVEDIFPDYYLPTMKSICSQIEKILNL